MACNMQSHVPNVSEVAWNASATGVPCICGRFVHRAANTVRARPSTEVCVCHPPQGLTDTPLQLDRRLSVQSADTLCFHAKSWRSRALACTHHRTVLPFCALLENQWRSLAHWLCKAPSPRRPIASYLGCSTSLRPAPRPAAAACS